MLQFYEGQSPLPGDKHIAISPQGYLYISATLGRDWPADSRYAQIGYDDQESIIVLSPIIDRPAGAAAVQDRCGRATRLNAKMALSHFGILPQQLLRLPADWSGKVVRIEVGLPKPTPEAVPNRSGTGGEREEQKANTDQPPRTRSEVVGNSVENDPPRQEDLLTAQEICDRYGIKSSTFYVLCSNGTFPKCLRKVKKRCYWERAVVEAWAKTHSRVPVNRLAGGCDGAEAVLPVKCCCLSCRWWKTPMGLGHPICQVERGPYRGQATDARQACNEYRPWNTNKAHAADAADADADIEQ
jgi:predicted DNA-binding transcriptional regulator AlpA